MAVPWHFDRDVIQLDHGDLTGVLPLRGPAPGLRNVARSSGKANRCLPGPLLAVRSVQAAREGSWAVTIPPRVERRLRADSVDVRLPESSRCPARIQLYWRAARPRQIDLEILVTSASAFDRLEVLTTSEAPAGPRDESECLVRTSEWLDARLPPVASWLVVPRDRDAAAVCLDGRSPSIDDMTLLPACRTPLVCFRPAGQSWSYVEMSHPDDCFRILARRQDRRVEWGFGLFGLDLEKGVILRGRVRGLFLSRRGDLGQAQRRFREFIAEPPRLSV